MKYIFLKINQIQNGCAEYEEIHDWLLNGYQKWKTKTQPIKKEKFELAKIWLES